MTWIRLIVHWIVSDCDLWKVNVYTPSRDYIGLHMHVVGCGMGIVDRLTKSAHFLAVQMTFTWERFCRLYV